MKKKKKRENIRKPVNTAILAACTTATRVACAVADRRRGWPDAHFLLSTLVLFLFCVVVVADLLWGRNRERGRRQTGSPEEGGADRGGAQEGRPHSREGSKAGK